MLEAARLDEVVDTSVRSLELSVLAKYAFGLAQAFNAFYHRQQILRRSARTRALWRAAAVAYVRRQLTRGARPDGLRRAGEDVTRISLDLSHRTA